MNEKDIEFFNRADSRIHAIVEPVRASADVWLEQNLLNSQEFTELTTGLSENDLHSVQGVMQITAAHFGLIELMKYERVKKELAKNMEVHSNSRQPLFVYIREILKWDMVTAPEDFLRRVDTNISEEYEKERSGIPESRPPEMVESYLTLRAKWESAKELVFKKYREEGNLLRLIPFSPN